MGSCVLVYVARSWKEKGIYSQLKGSMPPVRVSAPPLGHMSAVDVGCVVVRDGRSVELGKDQTYEFQQTQQNATLLSVTAGSSLLPHWAFTRHRESKDVQQVEGEKGSTAEEELQELTLLFLGGALPASAVPPRAGKHENDLTVPHCSHSMVGLFPDVSVSPRKCWHKPLYRSTKQEPRAKRTVTNTDCTPSLQPL